MVGWGYATDQRGFEIGAATKATKTTKTTIAMMMMMMVDDNE